MNVETEMLIKPKRTTKISSLSTGIPGLDQVLNGGIPSDRIYLIDGDPGAGKTTFGMQFLMQGVRLGEKVMYISLSETRDEIEAVASSHGWNLEGIEMFEFKAEEQLTADDQTTFFHPSEIELGETTKTILDAVKRASPSRVVFDSLSELRLLARESLRFRRQILALKRYFAGRESTVLLLDDRTSIAGDLELQSIVHGVIRLEQLSPEYGAERRRLRVHKLRGVGFRGGFHDFSLRRGGIQVFPRLVAAEYSTTEELKVLQSGVEKLDALLNGGIDRGSSTLIMGPAGCGKSTLTMAYAEAAAAAGEKVALFAFDEGKRSIFKRTKSLGIDIERHINSGMISLQQVDPAELSPGEFVSHVREAVDRGVRVIVIDSLNGYLNAMPEERFLIIQLHELLSYLNQKGVASFLVVAQHGLVGVNMSAPVDVSYLADTVIVLRYYEVFGTVKKAISVLKRRSGNHDRTIRDFEISSSGIEVGEPLRGLRGVFTGIPEQESTNKSRLPQDL
jgi:circadian clock protein KaiC